MFGEIKSIANLFQAFERVKASRGMPGVDGVSIRAFQCALEMNIRHLAFELESDTYRPLPLLRFEVAKKNGSPRPLAVPAVRDRVAQAVEVDLVAYFDNIDHLLLEDKLRKYILDEKVLQLLRRWIRNEVYDGIKIYTPGKGIAQGSVISPALANLFLDDFDEEIMRRGYQLVRYSDDFIILAKTVREAQAALELTDTVMALHHLRLDDDDTGITNFEKGFKYLGLTFVGDSIMIPFDRPSKPRKVLYMPHPLDIKRYLSTRKVDFYLPGQKANAMTFLYLTEQGAVLKKTSQRLIVEKDGQKLLDMPAAKIEGVMIFGNVQFTTQAVQLLLRQGVELALFSRSGRLLGQLTDPATKNIDLRIAQFGRHADPDFVLELARTLAGAKLANCLEFVQQFGHNHPEAQLSVEADQLQQLRPRIAEADGLPVLLGIEGSAARVYFQAFGKMVRHSFAFDGRHRRPATDPVNALLSLGYTMVYNEIASLLDGMGFDPYLGYYHQPRHGHATLASDLLEEFRTPLVDRFTLKIVNNRMFQEGDFYLHKPSGAVYLTDEARNRYFAAYEQFITQPTACAEDQNETTFRQLFRRQAERLKRTVIDGGQYKPFAFRW